MESGSQVEVAAVHDVSGEAVPSHDRGALPDDVHLLLDQATRAETSQDRGGALELLEQAIDRFPDAEAAYLRAASLCRTIERPYEAEMILVEGMCRFPSNADMFDAYAAIAEARQDWKEAGRRTRLLCEKFPLHGPSHLRLAAALRKAGRPTDAERALLRGQDHVQDEPHLLLDYAEIAAERGDWSEAARRFEGARQRYPDNWWAAKRAAEMLKQGGRPLEAETVLLEGQSRSPQEPSLFLDYADLAVDRMDWTLALQRFEVARDRFPDFWWPTKRLADTLKAAGRTAEAETVLLDGQSRFPQEAGLPLDHAEIAAEAGDWPLAQHRFELVRERFPDFWWPIKRLADMLKAAGRTEAAETVLLDGQSRFPQEAGLFFDHAEIAAEARDWPLAQRRFELLRERFPDIWWSSKRLAEALQALGRSAEAEAVLLEGQSRFPQESTLFFDHAERAADRKDWPQALHRFEDVRNRFPDIWWTYRRMAEICRFLERFDDAESLLLEGQRRFPDEPAMFFDHADIALRASRYQDALERYQAIHARFPDNYWGYVRLAGAFKALGHHADGEAILIDTMKAFPDESASVVELCFLTGPIPAPDRRISLGELGEMVESRIARHGETLELLNARAQLAQLNGDYPDYMRQLIRIAEIHPSAPGISERIVTAREILLGSGETVPSPLDEPAARPTASDEVPRSQQELFTFFESLGGGGPDGSTRYGCEFGFAQRRLEIEPLSLLRWTGVSLPNLTRLFARDFEGIGNPETTAIEYVPPQYDWRTVDTLYELRCDHTHLDRLVVPEEQARKMMCQRMTFLARKLREDLEDGEKIFVYRYAGAIEDEADVLALAEAMNRFGKNMLLFVCRADERHEPFTVRLVRPGLMLGYLDWFASDRFLGQPTDGTPANMIGWTRVCEAAYRLWRETQRAG